MTHDIDEAIKLGDRIAILREGGVLAQYDTPDEILAHPADEFVARFVGVDRGLKRLSLLRLSEIELEPAELAPADALALDGNTTLRDALSLMLSEGAVRSPGRVRRPRRVDLGRADRPAAGRGDLMQDGKGPVIPDFGAGSECVRENRTFCPDWVADHWDDTLWPRLVEHVELTVIYAVGIGFVIAFAAALVARRLRWFEGRSASSALRLHHPEPRALPAPRPRDRADGDDGRDRARLATRS